MTEARRVSPLRRARLTAMAVRLLREERLVPFSPREAVVRRRRRNLHTIVEHAHRHVPYYRETMGKLGLAPADIRDEGDLAKLPVIEREQLQRDPEYFRDETVDERGCLWQRSGGSTSAPVTVLAGPDDVVRRAASVARLHPIVISISGRRWRRRIVRIEPPSSSGQAFRTAYFKNLLRPFDPRTVPLDLRMDGDLDGHWAAINEFRPHVIVGFGSALGELFARAVSGGRPFHRPAVVVYAADQLAGQARSLISERLGIAVLSVYQAIETPQIGFECEQHAGYHLNDDISPVRILDEEGREREPGEPGEVVVSNLLNRTTVLLNYRLGDVAARLPEACGCGRNLPMLSFVKGRAGSPGVGSDGAALPEQLLIRPFSLDEGIWGYRVEQSAPGCFEGQVIAAAGADREAVSRRVGARWAEMVGADQELTISFVDALPRTAGGKVLRVSAGPGG